jgi:hypothetical protein
VDLIFRPIRENRFFQLLKRTIMQLTTPKKKTTKNGPRFFLWKPSWFF